MHTRLGKFSLEEHFRCSVRDRLSLAVQRLHDNPQVTDFGGELTAYQQEVRAPHVSVVGSPLGLLTVAGCMSVKAIDHNVLHLHVDVDQTPAHN